MGKEEMTSKERMMTALRGGVPDRVPVAPDISNMVPCRLTGKPFWDIYLHANPNLTMAYINAVKYFGMDGWLVDGGVGFTLNSEIGLERRTISQTEEAIYQKNIWHTPDGDLTETVCYSAGNPPAWTEKMIKDLPSDFKKIRHFFSGIKSYDASYLKVIEKEYGDLGLNSAMIVPPGFQTFIQYFEGNLESCVYAYYDERELFMELSDMHRKQELEKLDILLDCGYDAILVGASGSVTLQSPEIWDELTLPFIQESTAICKQAGVLTGMHSCGIQRHLIKQCVAHTDLGYVNPLEIPPMGDCILREEKEKYGDKIALMGNLHTTSVMLNPNPDVVLLESLRAIRDAGPGGGFVLSTGDQCGRDTPDENIRTMIRAGKEYGRYPLDMERIEEKIGELEKALEV